LYVSQTTPPPPFDPTGLLGVQFQVFTNASTAIPYAFCVSNFRLLGL